MNETCYMCGRIIEGSGCYNSGMNVHYHIVCPSLPTKPMTPTPDLTKLQALAEKLWQELEQLQEPYLEKRLEWAEVNRELERAKLRAEILAEQKAA